MTPQPQYTDTRDGRVGELMGYDGRRYLLRPLGGGREWVCPPEHARQVEAEPVQPSGVVHIPAGRAVPPCPTPCKVCRKAGRQ